MRNLLMLLLALQLGDSRADVYRRCVSCTIDCFGEHRRGAERDSCRHQCFRMKSSDCRQNGHGPGPKNTCSCT